MHLPLNVACRAGAVLFETIPLVAPMLAVEATQQVRLQNDRRERRGGGGCKLCRRRTTTCRSHTCHVDSSFLCALGREGMGVATLLPSPLPVSAHPETHRWLLSARRSALSGPEDWRAGALCAFRPHAAVEPSVRSTRAPSHDSKECMLIVVVKTTVSSNWVQH